MLLFNDCICAHKFELIHKFKRVPSKYKPKAVDTSARCHRVCPNEILVKYMPDSFDALRCPLEYGIVFYALGIDQ